MPFLQRSRQAPLARVSSRFLAAVAACACSLGLGGLCLAEPVSKSCQARARAFSLMCKRWEFCVGICGVPLLI